MQGTAVLGWWDTGSCSGHLTREISPSPHLPPPTAAGFVLLHSLTSLCLCWCSPNAICAQLSEQTLTAFCREKKMQCSSCLSAHPSVCCLKTFLPSGPD